MYRNRQEAGKMLANKLKQYAYQPDVIVLALPRGGVPVAYEIATALSVPLDIFIVRKLGVPGHEELAMGAMAMDGTIIFNEAILQELRISQTDIAQVTQMEKKELQRRELAYRGQRPFPVLQGKTIILVDDGIATGATMRAAITALRKQQPQKMIVAVPVADLSIYMEIGTLVDEIVAPLKPEYFHAVGAWYEDFAQTTDAEVHALLAKSHLNNK